MPQKKIFFWFRRDLRFKDNHGLFRALKQAEETGCVVRCIFIFDTNILSKLSSNRDARVQFIHQHLAELKQELQNNWGSDIEVWHGKPIEIWKEKLSSPDSSPNIEGIFCNHDYEPKAMARDQEVAQFCKSRDIVFSSHKDHCIFERNEVVKDDGKPYTVFTPYSKKWRNHLLMNPIENYPSANSLQYLDKFKSTLFPTLQAMGFESFEFEYPSKDVPQNLIKNYAKNRNFPSLSATSKLGLHFRFGSISIREKLNKALTLSDTFTNELIWRDFYLQILWHFPKVVNQSFKPQYDRIEWLNNEADFEKWKLGQTGYPIVDAGMRELNKTGFMHNRVRMIVASFLAKHLLIDWRWGEAYFAEKLLDFELASNNGGWQWAAGSGCDAAPYFRVFNPTLQTEKFDSQHIYIKKWIPEFGSPTYPLPMVDHAFARKRCLETYGLALKPT